MPSQGTGVAAAWKLLGTRSLKARIALVSGLVLAVGAWLAPETAPTALSAPEERPAPLLEEQVQLREVVRPFAGVQDVTARLKGQGVAIPPGESPIATRTDFSGVDRGTRAAGFGVFVTGTYVLTHAAALDGRSSGPVVTADGQSRSAKVVAFEAPTGLVLLETEPTTVATVAMASEPPAPGALAVAVGPWERRAIAVPVFITSVSADRYTVGGTRDTVLPGMPVYNLDGELFAIASGDPSGHAYPVRAAADRLMARVAAGASPASFGIGFQDLRGPLTRVFGERGVLVNHVVQNGPAHLAGMQAGDVVVTIGDVAIDSTDTAASALSAGQLESPTTVHVLRNGRDRPLEITPVRSYEVAALARAPGEINASGSEARELFTASVLERSGIPLDARVLAVNGRAISTRAQADRELRRRTQAVAVLLRHGDTRFFATIEPAP